VTQTLLNTPQAAVRLGKSRSTITYYVRVGRLTPALRGEGRTGGFWFNAADVDALAEAS
jgi:hypothetical protein